MAIEHDFRTCEQIITEYKRLCEEHPKARAYFIDYTSGHRDHMHRDGQFIFGLTLDQNKIPIKLLKDLTLH